MIRIKRTGPLDVFPDMIVAAAKNIGVPKIVDPSGQYLQVLSVWGSKLQEYDRELRRVASDDQAFGRRDEVGQLVEELNRCSGLYIVSTSQEVLLISDRTHWQYELIERSYQKMLVPAEKYSEACTEFIRDLVQIKF